MPPFLDMMFPPISRRSFQGHLTSVPELSNKRSPSPNRTGIIDNLISSTKPILRKINAFPRGRQLSVCDHDGRSITIWPAELERVFVCARTEFKAVDSLDDLFI